jgi:hypothetical protein
MGLALERCACACLRRQGRRLSPCRDGQAADRKDGGLRYLFYVVFASRHPGSATTAHVLAAKRKWTGMRAIRSGRYG